MSQRNAAVPVFSRINPREVMPPVERTRSTLAMAVALLAVLAACGDTENADTICFISQDASGANVITCDDGSQIEVDDGTVGEPGTTCSSEENDDGSVTINCTDGTSATIIDGLDGTGCSVFTEADGTVRVTCEDGGEATVEPGQTCTVAEEAGEVNITCDDGSEATITTGQDGEPCEVTTTEAGISITCGDETVTVDDGTDGGVCETTENEAGETIISCEGGTVVNVNPGDGRADVEGYAFLLGAGDHSGIEVTLTGPGGELTATTDASGYYTFLDVDTGNYSAAFEFAGFNTVEVPNVPAVPGVYRIPDVTLNRTDEIGDGQDVFIVDICPETGGVLWLEQYVLFEDGFGGPQEGGRISVPIPGESGLNVSAVGDLVYWDPADDSETVLGHTVYSEAVHCNPDGSLVAYLTDFDFTEDCCFVPGFVGDLRVWEVGGEVPTEPIAPLDSDGFSGRTASCGLGWSPDGTSIAFLSHTQWDNCSSYYLGQLNLYTHGETPELVTGDEALGDGVPCRLASSGSNDTGNGADDDTDDARWGFSEDDGAIRYTADVDDDFNCSAVGNLTLHRTSDHETWQLWGQDGYDYSAPFELSTFSEDGGYLAFVALSGDFKFDSGDLYLVDIAQSLPDTGSQTEYCLTPKLLGDPTGLHQRCVTDFNFSYGSERWYEFSQDSALLAYGDGDTLRVRDLATGLDLEEADEDGDIAFLNNWYATFDPTSSLLLYNGFPDGTGNGTEAGVGGGIGSGCGSSSLVLWDVTDRAPATNGTLVDSRLSSFHFPISFSEDGSELIFLNGDFSADLRHTRITAGIPAASTELVQGVDTCCSCGLQAVWSPSDEAFAYVSDDLGGSAVWLYSFTADEDVPQVAVVRGSEAFQMPIQFNRAGDRLIAFESNLSDPLDLLPSGDLSEWYVDDLSEDLLSIAAVFANYGAGNSVAFLELTDNEAGRANFKYAVDGDVVLADELVSLFNNVAMRDDDFVYAVREAFFPDLLRNGPHRLVLE